jgi:signal transduction histidine kinase
VTQDAERLHARLAECEQERDALAKVSAFAPVLSGLRDPALLAQQTTNLALELSGAQFAAWYAASDERATRYSLVAHAGVPRDVAMRFSMPYRSTVFDGRTVVRSGDITQEQQPARGTGQLRPLDRELNLKSYLAVPVITASSQGSVAVAALMLGHETANVFTAVTERVVVGLLAHAATALDNVRLYGDAQRLIYELERTNKELDQFTYAASHDLRAPLRGISNLATWIEEDLGEDVPPKIVEQLQLLRNRATRMDRLISGLLELARVGRARQKPERVDVTELVHETIDLLGPEHPARVLIVGAMPTINAERVALQQVLLNLIGNSLRHAGRADVEVRVSATEGPDEIELNVTDNGVGIPAEHRERVWQMFQTLAPRDVVESAGTGLAIVRKQVDACGGRAWIEDRANGATVRFTWPRAPKAGSAR